ncbi:MAG: peroxide stress protein YaaA [Tunicatimonas sp.]|uniref:peroxide stress protein YaaA n=1 Tax=Tunicatimonas sp. TaxID=1940096 RepID=UPI003C7529DE
MLTILSPSKTQDFSDSSINGSKLPNSTPALLNESEKLMQELEKKSVNDIAELMGVSEKIATLNHERFQQFSLPFTEENARQSLLAFKGDVYTDIAVEEYTKQEFAFAQNHLRIISGLYGLLRPLDLMQPYRLEMKTSLENSRGENLYKFWGSRITEQLNNALQTQENKVLVNLASNEYFKSIDIKQLVGEIITPVFKEYKEGKYKIVAIYAKRARGKMANFIIRQAIDEPNQLKTFTDGGYEYSDSLSSEREWVFIR